MISKRRGWKRIKTSEPFTVVWWLEILQCLRHHEEYEYADEIKQMLENEGYKISIKQNGTITVN